MYSHIQPLNNMMFWNEKKNKGNAQNEVFARQSVTHVPFITDESFA